jgi:hypothetical protein
MADPCAQRFDRIKYPSSLVRNQISSAKTIINGRAIPMHAKMMWNASDIPI